MNLAILGEDQLYILRVSAPLAIVLVRHRKGFYESRANWFYYLLQGVTTLKQAVEASFLTHS
jgi:hypothetical protein